MISLIRDNTMKKNKSIIMPVILSGLVTVLTACNSLKRYEDYFPKDAVKSNYFPDYAYDGILNDNFLLTKEVSDSKNIYYSLKFGTLSGDTMVFIDVVPKSDTALLDSTIDVVLFKGRNMARFEIYKPPAENVIDKVILDFGGMAFNSFKSTIYSCHQNTKTFKWYKNQ